MSNDFLIKETNPAFSILQAVINMIWPRKLSRPTAMRIHQLSEVSGIMLFHIIMSYDKKWSPNLTMTAPKNPTMLKHAMMLKVGMPGIYNNMQFRIHWIWLDQIYCCWRTTLHYYIVHHVYVIDPVNICCKLQINEHI